MFPVLIENTFKSEYLSYSIWLCNCVSLPVMFGGSCYFGKPVT